MITRRIGAPCSTDAWHEENRFVGAVKKHEIFIWDKYNGLEQALLHQQSSFLWFCILNQYVARKPRNGIAKHTAQWVVHLDIEIKAL